MKHTAVVLFIISLLWFGSPAVFGQIIINELDADQTGTDTTEFIELYDGGVGNTSLDGYVVVLFNGSGDVSYLAVDLDGYSTSTEGYFLLGSTSMANADIQVAASNWLQNGADAVALYMADAADFPNGTPVTTTNLVDAVVYDTNDADDAGLLTLLNGGEPQVNEDMNGNKDTESIQRCPNGSGGARNTSTFAGYLPTDRSQNTCQSTATNTPGPTDTPVPPTDTPTSGPTSTPAPVADIKINELYFNSPGTDAGCYIELFYSGPLSLDGYSIVGVNGSNGSDYNVIDLTGYSIPTDGYFVVAQDGTVADADLIDSNADFQNGPDSVQLRMGATVVDAIGYGDFSSATFAGEGSAAPASFPGGGSHSRIPDGADSDDNSADFFCGVLTPGSTNVICADTPTPQGTNTPGPTDTPVPPTDTPTPGPTSTPYAGMCSDNQVLNPGFENWTAGSPDNWTAGNGLTPTLESTTVFDGSYSVKLDLTSTSVQSFTQEFPVAPNQTYALHLRYYDNDPAVHFRLWCYFLNSGSTTGSAISTDYSADAAGWQQWDLTGLISPTDADGFRFEIRAYDTGTLPAVFYLDNAEFCGPAGTAWTATPTPLVTDTPGPTNTPAGNFGDVVINEIMYDSQGVEEEWVELFNTTEFSIDISNWIITDSDDFPNLSGEGYLTIPAGTTIAAGEYLVFSKLPLDEIDCEIVCVEEGLFQLNNPVGDNVALFTSVSGNNLVDGSLTVLYPDLQNNQGISIEKDDESATWPMNPPAGWHLSTQYHPGNIRHLYHTACGPNSLPATPSPTVTPGGPTPTPPPVTDIKINEIYIDPVGGDTGCYVELYFPSAISLDGYQLVGVNGSDGTDYAVIDLSGYTVPTDGYFVIGQDGSVVDADMTDVAVNFQNGPDSIQLRYYGVVVDAVAYGDFSGGAVIAGEGEPIAVTGEQQYSYSRIPDGADTEDNATDFMDGELTSGASNVAVLPTATPTSPPTATPEPIPATSPAGVGLMLLGISALLGLFMRRR